MEYVSNMLHYIYRFGNIGPGSLGAAKGPQIGPKRPKMGKIRVYLVVATKFWVD